MTIKRVCFVFFLAVFLSSYTFQPAMADDLIINAMMERGVKAYERGDQDAAIYEFKKVLLIDPAHQGARKYLRELGLDYSYNHPAGFKVPGPSYRDQIVDMDLQIQHYTERIASLSHQRQVLEDTLLKMAENKDELWRSKLAQDVAIDVMQQESQMAEARYEQLKDKLNYEQSAGRLQQMGGIYNQMTAGLKYQLYQQQAQLDRYEKANKDLSRRYNQAVDQSLWYGDRMSDIDSENDYLRYKMTHNYDNMERLLDVIQDYLVLREQSLNESQNSLVKKEIELTRGEQEFLEKLDELIHVYGKMEVYEKEMADRDIYLNVTGKDLDYLERKIDQMKRILEKEQ